MNAALPPGDHETAPAAHLTSSQVRAYRLGRQHLLTRAPARRLVRVVGEMGGAQAQLLSAAQLSVWARVGGVTVSDVDRELWDRRALTKAWCMRRTLHLVPSDDLAEFVRGSARRAEKELRWARNRGVPARTLERLVAATLDTLDAPVTRTELARRVARATGLPLAWDRGGGWGNARRMACVKVGPLRFPGYYLLHLAGARGVVCSGPARDGEATFVRAEAWLTSWSDLEVDRAEDRLLDRYLGRFGPANPEDYVAWTQMRLRDAREIWDRRAANLVPVAVDGRIAWSPRPELARLERSERDGPSVRLLPHFDSYLLGHRGRAHLVDAAGAHRVYRPQGWVVPVVLVDGRVRGTWTHRVEGRTVHLRVEPFDDGASELAGAVREEAEDLARFLELRDARVSFR